MITLTLPRPTASRLILVIDEPVDGTFHQLNPANVRRRPSVRLLWDLKRTGSVAVQTVLLLSDARGHLRVRMALKPLGSAVVQSRPEQFSSTHLRLFS